MAERQTNNAMAERKIDNTMAERKTDNTMAERKITKWQTITYNKHLDMEFSENGRKAKQRFTKHQQKIGEQKPH